MSINIKYLSIVLVVVMLAIVAPVEARKDVQYENCEMLESIMLDVTFSNVPIDITYVKQEAGKIQLLAKDMGIEDITIQNMSYNTYNNNSSGGCGQALSEEHKLNGDTAEYKLSGYLSFMIDNAEKAKSLMDKLIEQGYNVNFSMSAYRQCQ